MADWSQNVSNTVSVFWGAPTSQWGSMTWGESNWGEGSEDLSTDVGKFIANSQESTTTVAFEVEKVYGNTLSPTEDLTEQQLTDGSGYNYVFRRPSTDAEDRTLADWTEQDATISSWSCQAAGSTTWSEV